MFGDDNLAAMQVAFFDRSEQPLVLEQRPRPSPGTGEVLVRVRRCGICTSDIHWTNGHGMTPDSGTVLGHEFSGDILEVGHQVGDIAIGDRVSVIPFAGCGICASCIDGDYLFCPEKRSLWGGFGQYTIAAASSCVKLADTLSWEEAALVEPMACGAHAVRLAKVDPGMNVLVIGAGPIGLSCSYWLRHRGVKSITIAAKSSRRKALAKIMGATCFIEASNDLTHQVSQHIGTPDIIFECTGVPGILMQTMRLVKARGKVIVAGMCTTPDTVIPAVGIMKELELRFVAAYSRQDFVETVNAMGAGDHSPVRMINKTIALRQLPKVFEEMHRSNSYCKVMVDPWSVPT